MHEICISIPAVAQTEVPALAVPSLAFQPYTTQTQFDTAKPSTDLRCYSYHFLGGSEKESEQINHTIEDSANESPLHANYIGSALSINITIAVCDTQYQPNALASYDPLTKTLRLPRSIFKHARFEESLRHELYHVHCHARYIAHGKHTYGNLAFKEDQTYPYQTADEKINFKKYLKKGLQRIQKFNENPDADVLEKFSKKVESSKQKYQYSMTSKNPELRAGMRAIFEAQYIASDDFYKFVQKEGYPQEQYLSEQGAHFFARVPAPVIEHFFPELRDFTSANANRSQLKNTIINSVPFQPPKNKEKYCQSMLTWPIDILIDHYQIEPTAENIDLFFDRVEVLFKGSIENPRARKELKNNLQSVLNKGLIAGDAHYRLKAHLYLAGIAVLDAGDDRENLDKWKQIEKLYKQAEKDLKDTPMEANQYAPEFNHDNFYAYSLYITGSQQTAEHVAKRKPFTPK